MQQNLSLVITSLCLASVSCLHAFTSPMSVNERIRLNSGNARDSQLTMAKRLGKSSNAIETTVSLQQLDSVDQENTCEPISVAEGGGKRRVLKVANYYADATLASSNTSPNNNDISFTIFGDPVPLSRHMVSRGRMYNPSAKLQQEFAAVSKPFLPLIPFEGPVEASLFFYFSRPKNHYGTGKNSEVLKSSAGLWHSKRKDLDNLVKFILDSLNQKVYVDDSQVASIKCAKFYTENKPRTELRFRILNEDEANAFLL